MVKRVLTLLALVSLILGIWSTAWASRHDFETRGSRDYPPRIVGFVLFPVGLILDLVVFRPIGYLACSMPDVTGCHPEERKAYGLEKVRETEVPPE